MTTSPAGRTAAAMKFPITVAIMVRKPMMAGVRLSCRA